MEVTTWPQLLLQLGFGGFALILLAILVYVIRYLSQFIPKLIIAQSEMTASLTGLSKAVEHLAGKQEATLNHFLSRPCALEESRHGTERPVVLK